MANACKADTWLEYLQGRWVDPTSRYYVVIRVIDGWGEDPGRGGPVAFTTAEQQPDSPVVSSARDKRPDLGKFDKSRGLEQWDIIRDPNVKVRKGDRILGRGRLERAPLYVHVSSSGLGFVTLDVHGYNYRDLQTPNAVVIIANDGTVRHRKNWADIFNKEEVALFTVSAGGAWWLRASWIDEVHRQVVVVGRAYTNREDAIRDEGPKKYLYRTVSFETGQVQHSTSAEVISALRQKNLGALGLAIGLASESKLMPARKHLVNIADDKQLTDEIRKLSRAALLRLSEAEKTEGEGR